jgi:hypothetical protein
MAMTSASCLSAYKAYIAALPALPPNDLVAARARGDEMVQLIFQTMIDELHTHGVISVVTNGSATTQSCNNGTIA